MAVGYIKRLAGPYTGAGTTELPFGFKIFEPTDVYVAVAANSADPPVHLVYGTDYTVSMNESQDATPGGTVTLVAALSGTQVAVVGSALAYTQETQLTNYNRFPPEIVNTALDRIVVQIQQIIEQLGRVLKVPETADITPEELIKSLQDAAETATVIAKGYAEAAAASAADAKKSRDDILEHQQEVIDAITTEGDRQYQRLVSEGNTQDQRLVTEGNTQIDRIKAEADNTLIGNGTGCAEKFWALSADTPAGTDIVIPSGIKYLVDRHHLRVAWNGLVLAIGQNFTEVGAQDTFSTTFRLTFDAKAGDEIDVWIGALGKGDVAEALALAGEASAAVADLSRKVVYKEEV